MSIDSIKNLNIAEIIIHHVTNKAIQDKPYLMFRNKNDEIQSITYRQYYKKSLEYGNMIHQITSEKQTNKNSRFHVGVFMQNIPEFFYIFGGCAFTGATLVGINTAQKGETLAFDINKIDINLLFVDTITQPGTQVSFLETVLKVNDTIGFSSLSVEHIIPITNEIEHTIPALQSIPEKLNTYRQSLQQFKPKPLITSDTGVIIFTSGTTGVPKGIEVSWQKLVDVGLTATSILRYTEHDTGYVCMPINHSNSLYLNIMPAFLNSSRILIRRRFSVSNFIRDIKAVGATVWNCVGDPVQYLLNYIDTKYGKNADFSFLSLRTVISTGTNAANRAAFTRLFGLENFKEVYGSTEAGAITAVDETTPDYSVGRILKDVRVINEETSLECVGAKLNKNNTIGNLDVSAGEIIVSQNSLGNSAFSGYYKLPKETKKRVCILDNQEFYRMGDLGAIVSLNALKYLIFLGRTGDWIRCKGENWAPMDCEKIINNYAAVSNVGIIGVPQSVGKEDDPLYVLETENPDTFSMIPFLEYCKEYVPHYMFPRFVRLVTKLPMTETMKLKKSNLKYDFYFRSPQIDADNNDHLYKIFKGKVHKFVTLNYIKEIAEYKDPTNQDTLKTFTKRPDLFTN